MLKICETILTDMLAYNTGLNIQISMYMIKICEQSLTDTACNTGLHIQISMYMIKISEQSLTINIIFTES